MCSRQCKSYFTIEDILYYLENNNINDKILNLLLSSIKITSISEFSCYILPLLHLGNEQIKIGNKNYDTLHFNFSSSDKKLSKNKKLNTDIWYDEKTLNWVKASFNKKGKWEYRLVFIE